MSVLGGLHYENGSRVATVGARARIAVVRDEPLTRRDWCDVRALFSITKHEGEFS